MYFFLQMIRCKKLRLEKKTYFYNARDKNKASCSLSLFFCLDILLLSLKKRQEILEKTDLILIKTIKNFEYRKNNNSY